MTPHVKCFEALEKIRLACRIGHRPWAELLRLTEREYKLKYLYKKEVDLSSLENVSEVFHVSVEHLIAGTFDLAAVVAHYSGRSSYIPEKYTVGAFSKTRSAYSMFHYVDKHFGFKPAYEILRKLQIQPPGLRNQDNPINILLLSDFLEEVSKLSPNPHHPLEIGATSVAMNKAGPLGSLLSSCKTPREVYDSMITDFVGLYERNSKYWIEKLTDDFCIVRSATTQEASDAFGVKHVGSKIGCICRGGILRATPEYIDLPRANVQKTKCVFNGDPYCEFIIDFSLARKVATNPKNVNEYQAASGNLIDLKSAPKTMRERQRASYFFASANA